MIYTQVIKLVGITYIPNLYIHQNLYFVLELRNFKGSFFLCSYKNYFCFKL